MAHKFCTSQHLIGLVFFSFFQKSRWRMNIITYMVEGERERAHFVLIKAPETDPCILGWVCLSDFGPGISFRRRRRQSERRMFERQVSGSSQPRGNQVLHRNNFLIYSFCITQNRGAKKFLFPRAKAYPQNRVASHIYKREDPYILAVSRRK